MGKSNTNYIATQDEAKTIAQSSKSVVMGRLATKTTDNYMNPTYNYATDENNSTAVLDVREYDNDIGNRYGLVNYPAR